MARSIPIPVPQPMTAAEYRQHCHDIIRTHRPGRKLRHLWRQHCVACGEPWTKLGDMVGCWPVRGAVAELAGQRPTGGRWSK